LLAQGTVAWTTEVAQTATFKCLCAAPAWWPPGHLSKRGSALGGAAGASHAARDGHAVAILHEHMPVGDERGLSWPLLVRTRRASGSVVEA